MLLSLLGNIPLQIWPPLQDLLLKKKFRGIFRIFFAVRKYSSHSALPSSPQQPANSQIMKDELWWLVLGARGSNVVSIAAGYTKREDLTYTSTTEQKRTSTRAGNRRWWTGSFCWRNYHFSDQRKPTITKPVSLGWGCFCQPWQVSIREAWQRRGRYFCTPLCYRCSRIHILIANI